jgi:hypothetical protein
MNNQEDHEQRQQNVNRSHNYVESEEAKQPCDQEYYRERQPHTSSSRVPRPWGAALKSDGKPVARVCCKMERTPAFVEPGKGCHHESGFTEV